VIKDIYKRVKTDLLKIDRSLQFNSQTYYISLRKGRNLAFFHFSGKRISLVVKNPEKDTRKVIKHHEVKTLTEKVQKFWNGPSCTIVIENEKHLNEVIALLRRLIS
jgi:predicted transport protein